MYQTIKTAFRTVTTELNLFCDVGSHFEAEMISQKCLLYCKT